MLCGIFGVLGRRIFFAMKTSTKQEPNATPSSPRRQANMLPIKNQKMQKSNSKSNDNNAKTQEDEHQVESFQTLLNNLATICSNDCRTAKDHTIVFNTTTTPTTFQETLLNQLKNIADNLNTPQ
jgi:hypothetical protein